ncbi:hypothetical protein R1sor_013690 [Riccia sorocarpa]|uniref:Uncharacterized protein n=1 Tax=Riccia sorocarpa TaxID=122646 RepID=A0ABD3H964_9MARC
MERVEQEHSEFVRAVAELEYEFNNFTHVNHVWMGISFSEMVSRASGGASREIPTSGESCVRGSFTCDGESRAPPDSQEGKSTGKTAKKRTDVDGGGRSFINHTCVN